MFLYCLIISLFALYSFIMRAYIQCSFHNRRNSLANMVNIAAVERGHAQAARIGAVNAEFAAQALHLLF